MGLTRIWLIAKKQVIAQKRKDDNNGIEISQENDWLLLWGRKGA